MDFKSRYDKLNASQRRAVDAIDGSVMVIAGPGTGKTELLSMRAANILRKTDSLAESILCLTFTESGATAMRQRLTQIIGVEAYKVAIHTFHSFGSDIISQYRHYFYQGAHFRPADELSSYEMLRSLFDGLDHDNPLLAKMNGEYTYLSDTLTTISELKKSGLTSDELLLVLDANDQVIDSSESVLAPLFAKRIGKGTAEELRGAVASIRESGGEVELPAITPLSKVLVGSLEAAVEAGEAADSTKPLTAWRNAWMKKNAHGEYVLKSRERQTKLRSVAGIYFQYLSHMQESELYDFDDMILRVVHALEVFPELRLNLQEKYQYIMVDEFQDTNMAQMRILYNLTNNEVSGGNPNIMVVGDDDQAIYSFQGADVGNINYFLELFPKATRISLVDNYRSTPTILTHARHIITQGNDRLENSLTDLDKTLTSHHDDKDSAVELYETLSSSDERRWLVEDIAAHIKNGTRPSDIAVLARRHHEIVALLPYFTKAGIKVSYERQDNVLDLPIIKLIELLSQVVIGVFEQRHGDANSLLPELLAHPAFSISPGSLWKLSVAAYTNRLSWLEVMAVTPEFVPLHLWLITQAQAVPHTPVERLLDTLIGVNQPPDGGYISPIYEHYFGGDNLEKSPNDYLVCLEALRTIRSKLREYQPDTTPSLVTFIEFIHLHRQQGSTLTSIRQSASFDTGTIQLMTAHKSKGLEFDTVYIVGAVDSAWGEHVRGRSRLLSYPENLPLMPAGDSADERLRLFFVAMTRAKRRLVISYALTDDGGKALMPASFLVGELWQPQPVSPPSSLKQQAEAITMQWYEPIISPIQPDMRTALKPILGNYRLSITHLTAFLDVSRGGPQTFLMQNLLRFPKARHPATSYGVAIHAALQRAHTHLIATGSSRPQEDILRDYEESLRTQYLAEKDFEFYLQKGSDVLTAFLDGKPDAFNQNQRVEVNFAHQGVHIGGAHLTGSLDMIEINDTLISVTDYKTGKPSSSWIGKTDYEKIKLHKYKQQLMFYELLLRRSRDYSTYQVDRRRLQFVEPTLDGSLVTLEADFTPEETARFERLIQAVWRSITTLNLPDISQFEPSYKGMLAFEAFILDEQ